MELFIQNFRFIFIWIYAQYCIHLSDGLLWIEKPNEYTLVKLGFNITIKWHYRMQENETFYYSEINNIASRPKIEKSFELLDKFDDPLVKVSGKWNVNLTIINATQQRNSKTYCCRITFERNGKTTNNENCTTLVVYDPPRILYHTPDKRLTQTSNFTLRCNSSGDPIPILHWTKDNICKSIGNSSNVFVTITGKGSEEKYCCQAKNKFGNDTACTKVNVTEYQPTKTILTTNANYIIRNKTLRILCWAEASPPANYLIYQGKVKLGNFSYGNVTITTGNGTTENISCISKNKYGEGTPAYLSIPIYDPPRILYHTPDKLLTQTSKFTLRCNSSGDPIPIVHWTKDNIYKSIGNSSYVFVTITGKGSEGKYCCHAKNEYGDDTACTTVHVTEYQPTKTILTTNTNFIIRNKTLRILCWAEASPPAHYLIYQGKVKLGNFSYGNVTITTGNGTTENISCISKNKYGEGTPAYLSIPIYVRPRLTFGFRTRYNMSDKNINITCRATGIPTPTITWTREETGEIVSFKEYYEVPYVKYFNKTLVFYCRANNIVGDMKTKVEVLTQGNNVCKYSKDISQDSLSEAIIIALAAAATVLLLCNVTLLVYIICRKRKDTKKTEDQREINERRQFRSGGTIVEKEQVEGFPVSTDAGIRSEQQEPNVCQDVSVEQHIVAIPLYETVGDSASYSAVNTQLQVEDKSAKHNPVSAITRATIQRQKHPTPAEPIGDNAVAKQLPENATTYQPVGLNIHEYSSLSSFTRPPKENKPSSGKSHKQGIEPALTKESEYQALGEKDVMPEYQSLYGLNKC